MFYTAVQKFGSKTMDNIILGMTLAFDLRSQNIDMINLGYWVHLSTKYEIYQLNGLGGVR